MTNPSGTDMDDSLIKKTVSTEAKAAAASFLSVTKKEFWEGSSFESLGKSLSFLLTP